MFEKIREKLFGSDSDGTSAKKEDAPAQKEDDSSSTYKCWRCGKHPLSGPVLYCDGCGQYCCYECGIASGDMIWECANCAIVAHRVVL